jgi:glycosyltransferase involved in cell wall biosynthesis
LEIAVSVVIPCFNEAGSVAELAGKLVSVLDRIGRTFEILFVDDGSNDGTFDALTKLHESDPRIKVLKFRANFGKSAALQAGFTEAAGDVVITMDADLQDDPDEIPLMLAKIDEGYDLISGWKKVRRDPVEKRVPSKLFNRVTAVLTGVPLHDFNCGFKAYRREVLGEIDLYGEMHRFIPVLAHRKGFRIGEVEVRHHPRAHGKSKFGFERYLRGATDLFTILFLTKYLKRPAHFFGGAGILTSLAGTVIFAYLTALWFLGNRPIGNRPLLFLGILLIITGVQLFSLGLIGEMLARAGARHEAGYSVEIRLV